MPPDHPMPSFKRPARAAIVIALTLASAATLAFALPGPSACLFIGAVDLHRLPDGSLTDSASASDRLRYLQLTRDARARIESTFGAVNSKPVLVYFNGRSSAGSDGSSDGRSGSLGPFKLNSYGSTQFIGSRACILIGPQGQNVDVVAHELMHGELHHRVGYWQRFLQVPTWFDEGLAMQVDFRPRYTLSSAGAEEQAYLKNLTTSTSFFVADDKTLTRHYALAKRVVADWLHTAGANTLYPRLQRIQDGATFIEATTE